MSNASISKSRTWVRDLKVPAISFGLGFFLIVIFFELLFALPSLLITWEKDRGMGYTYTRFRKEGTAVELYAEDIWRNGRRTLKTAFDPSSCTIRYLEKAKVIRWSEVECIAFDEAGRRWYYVTRYSDNFTVLFFIPFFVDIGPARELKITNPGFIHQETVK